MIQRIQWTPRLRSHLKTRLWSFLDLQSKEKRHPSEGFRTTFSAAMAMLLALMVVFADGRVRYYPLVHLWWYGPEVVDENRTKPLDIDCVVAVKEAENAATILQHSTHIK